MKRIAITTSGCILLLGALFYGLILKNQPRSAPAPKASLLEKTEESPASAPSEPAANSASFGSVSGNTPSPAAEANPAVVTSKAVAKPWQHQTAGHQEASQRSSENRTSSKPKPTEDPAALDTDNPSQAQAPVGIRLAPDVRLPAAAMPLDFKISSVTRKALDGIVMDYYREIASIPQDQTGNHDPANASAADVVEETETGELTRVIKNSPAVDEARKRADYRFKALLGFKAYNRMTMDTLLEARRAPLPEE